MQNEKAHEIFVSADTPSPAGSEQYTTRSTDSTSPSFLAGREGRRFYYPELDAVRTFLFVGVWTYHALPRDDSFYLARHVPVALASLITTLIKAGMCSLDAFFVLSAFLITELLLREREQRGKLDLKTFYVRRLLRIWPLYFFMILLAGVLSIFDRSQPLTYNYALAFLLFAGNWSIVFRGYPEASMIGPLWSVSFEEQFYLIWPLVLRKASRTILCGTAVALFVVATIARVILLQRHSNFMTIWYNSFVRLDSIAGGILLAVFLHRRTVLHIGRRLRILLFSTGISAWLVVGRFCGLHRPIPPFVGGMLGFPLMSLGAVILFLAVLGASDDGLPFLKHPWLVYLGKISYGLYAYHILALRASFYIFSHYHHSFSLTLVLLYALGLTFSMAALSFEWLEAPVLRLKQRKFTYIPSGAPMLSAKLPAQDLREEQPHTLNLNVSSCLPSTEL